VEKAKPGLIPFVDGSAKRLLCRACQRDVPSTKKQKSMRQIAGLDFLLSFDNTYIKWGWRRPAM
jgi:hypothetical protein